MDNLATVMTIYEAFGKGDIPTILDRLADDIRWDEWANNFAQQAGVPWLEARSGKAGVMEFFQFVGRGMQVTDFRVLSLMAGNDQVVAEVVIEVEVLSSGGHYRDEELHLWTFNDAGKVVRLRHYTDTAKHIAAASGQR
jgi:ketosteroid isomerase-like protein